MKSLVLAEKPSVGKELAKVLGCSSGGKGYFEGKSFIVTWAMGHLVELADPSRYDPKYKSWKLEDLPMLPVRMKFRVIGKTSKQFNTIKSLMKRSDIGSLVIATDAGREGELVARLIMKLASWKGPFKRLWISSQTTEAIKHGFSTLKDGEEYDRLYAAALARAEADWIVGLNITRALSTKYDVRLSSGRVQTPTLNLIAEREKERNDFKPKPFWQIRADFGSFSGLWKGGKGGSRIFKYDEALKIKTKVAGSKGRVVSVSRKKKNIPPPYGYDLTSLQRDANSRLAFSAKKTLSVLQVLYERYKIATYPRTDSRYITEDIVPTLPKRLKSLKNTPYAVYADELLKKPVKPGKRFVNNAKVTDHHAIIPTGEVILPERLSAEERKLMNLIMERFIAVLSPPAVKEYSKAVIEVNGQRFYQGSVRVLEKGWLESGTGGGEDEDEDYYPGTGVIPDEGTELLVKSVDVREETTTPPARYTEGTLLGAMENPSGYLKNSSLKDSLSRGGIGTPATRADIIEKIIKNDYVTRRERELSPTPRGLELLSLVPEELKQVDLTAQWEMQLHDIAEGKENPVSFLREIREKTKEFVTDIKNSTQKYTPLQKDGKKCPLCSRPMALSKDKRGHKIYVCHTLSCGYTESGGDHSGSPRPGKREKAMNRRLISQYSDKSKSTATFADLIKEAERRRT